MPVSPSDPQGFSDRIKRAIFSVSAAGDPEAEFDDDEDAQWGDSEDDYHEYPRDGLTASTREETIDWYGLSYKTDIRIIESDDDDEEDD